MPYFLDGKSCPPDDPHRSEVLAIAEMIADIHDLGLQHTRTIPDKVHQDCWPASVIESLKQPILSEVLRTPQPWYPELRLFFATGGRDTPTRTEPHSAKHAVGTGQILDSGTVR